MMMPEKTNRILLWLNLILLIFIGSAIVTFIFLGSRKDTDTSGQGVINSINILRSELGLTDEQCKRVLMENERTVRTYNIVLDLMCETNVAMIEELAKPESDARVLDSLSKKIGNLNTSLRKETCKYFLNLKEICTDEQQKKLTLIFKNMMQLEEQCKTCNKKDCPRKERIYNLGKK